MDAEEHQVLKAPGHTAYEVAGTNGAGSWPSHWTRLPPTDTQAGEKAKAAVGPGQCVRHTETVQGESSSW